MSLKLHTTTYILLYLIVVSNIQFVLSTSWATSNTCYEFKELDWDETFVSDTANWYLSSQWAGNKYTQCNTVNLLGGVQVLGNSGSQNGAYFQRSFSSIPAHSMIRFSMTIYAIDNWSNDKIRIKVDNRLLSTWTMTLNQGSFYQDICGNSGKDVPDLSIYGSFTHQKSDVTFQIISLVSSPSNVASFGIRDFFVTFDNNPIGSEWMCSTGYTSGGIGCSCNSKTQYMAGSCQTCHPFCDSCYGPGPSKCIACKSGYSWNGYECMKCHPSCDSCVGSGSNDCVRCAKGRSLLTGSAPSSCPLDCPYPLTKTNTVGVDYCTAPCSGNYLYWDKTCLATCPSPYQIKTILNGARSLCIYPCGPGDYLYTDGTCQTDCPSPLTSSKYKGYNLCGPPTGCTGYLYPDGSTCSATCTAPLQAKTIQGIKLCLSPCQKSTDYLYWDSECRSTCPTNLYTTVTTYGVQFCNYPCTGANYRFWDSTCSTTCDPPLIPTTNKGKLFCVYPTPTANYLYWDGTTSSNCDLPLTAQTVTNNGVSRLYCTFKCNIWEYLRFDGTCLLHCNAPFVRRLTNGRRFCDSPCSGTNSLFWDGTCRATSTCVAPLLPSSIGTKDICGFPTGDITQYLYWDGTFLPTCPKPFHPRTDSDGIRKYCEHPCSGGTPVLGWDGSCYASCSTPGTSTTYKTKTYCKFPCDLPQYLNYDTNCIDSCQSPWISTIEGAGQFCDHPCDPSLTDYYYWDSTCDANCDPPLYPATMDNLKWCVYPCEGTQFLYTNGTCMEYCEAPFVSTVTKGMNFCENPCGVNEALYWNTSCFPVMLCTTSPMTVVSTNMGLMCEIPCASPLEFYYEPTKTCILECDSESILDLGLYLLCKAPIPVDTTSLLDMFINAPNSTVPTLVTPVRILEYIRYVNINYPPRLQRMLTTQGSPILTLRFGKNMSESLQESFPYYDLPGVFAQYDWHSNFIVNFWKEMLSWLIVLAVIVGLVAIQEICQRNNLEKALPIIEKLVVVWKWNIMLILVAMSVPDIILYSSLQFRTVHFSSKFVGISLEFAVLMIGVIAMLFTGIAYLASGLLKAKDTQLDEKQGEYFEKWKGYQTIFRGYRDDVKGYNSLFYLIYLCRISLPMLIASYLYMVPILQTLLFFTISLLITVYILMMRPVIKRINFIQLLMTETIILIINLCLFIMTALDLGGDTGSSSYILLGDFVVGGNSVINLLFIVIFLLKIGGAIYRAIKRQKTGESWLKGEWVEIFPVFFSQIGFGFEDISPDPKADFNMYNRLLITEKGIKAKDRAEAAFNKKNRHGIERKEEKKKEPSILNRLKNALIKPKEESNLKGFTEVINFEAPNKLVKMVVEERPETPVSQTIETEQTETEPQEETNRLQTLRRRTTVKNNQPDVLTIKDMLPPPKVVERQWTPNIEKVMVENEDREKNVLAYLARKGVFAEEEDVNELKVGKIPQRRQTKAETNMFYNPNFLGVTSADVRKVDLRNIVEDEMKENEDDAE